MPATNIPAHHLIHRLLFQALLEMRSQGQENQDKVVFHLADLFHNVVLEMERAAQGDCTYEEVYRFLEEQAHEQGCDQWLNAQVTQLLSKNAADLNARTS